MYCFVKQAVSSNNPSVLAYSSKVKRNSSQAGFIRHVVDKLRLFYIQESGIFTKQKESKEEKHELLFNKNTNQRLESNEAFRKKC